jgi:lauroyl/myristoyl acyltransferase
VNLQQAQPFFRLKDLAWLIYLYPARWLARFLPLAWLYAAADVAAALAPFLLRGPRRRLRERLRSALADPADVERIADQYFRNAMLRFLDDLLMERLLRPPRDMPVRMLHVEHLSEALSHGHGAILVSGHFLASRLGKRYLAAHGFPALSVRNHRPADLWAGRFGARFLLPRYVAFIGQVQGEEVSIQDPECTLKMLARLRSGGLIDCHIDAPLSRDVLEREFMGAISLFPAGYLHVASLADAPLVPLHCRGNSRGLEIEFGDPLLVQPIDDRQRFAAGNVDRLLRALEEHIRLTPAEWDLWLRW